MSRKRAKISRVVFIFLIAVLLPLTLKSSGPCAFCEVFVELIGGPETQFKIQKVGSTHWDENYDIVGSNELVGGTITVSALGEDGWSFIGAGPEMEDRDTVGHGIYQLIKLEGGVPSTDWIVIDFTTTEYGEGCCGTSPDINIIYNDGDFICGTGLELCEGSVIENHTILKVWEEIEEIDENTDDFQPSNPPNLNYSWVGGHPKLTWSSSVPGGAVVIKYHVYRKKCPSQCGGSGGSYKKLTSSAQTSRNYTDTGVNSGNGLWFYYRIRAFKGSKSSPGYSNIVELEGAYSQAKRALAENEIKSAEIKIFNSPNPFNPSTWISYTLPEAVEVHLAVYDLNGREVAKLFEGSQPAGRHKIRWDGTGSPSGVYIYRLKAGDKIYSGKMSLMK